MSERNKVGMCMRVEEKQEQRYSEMKEEKQIEGKERQKAWNKKH